MKDIEESLNEITEDIGIVLSYLNRRECLYLLELISFSDNDKRCLSTKEGGILNIRMIRDLLGLKNITESAKLIHKFVNAGALSEERIRVGNQVRTIYHTLI